MSTFRDPTSPVDLLRVLHQHVARMTDETCDAYATSNGVLSNIYAERNNDNMTWLQGMGNQQHVRQIRAILTASVRKAELRQIRIADAYYVAAPMTELLLETTKAALTYFNEMRAEKLAGGEQWNFGPTIREETLPSDHGFVYFERGIPMRDPEDGPFAVHYLTWHKCMVPAADDPNDIVPGYLSTAWVVGASLGDVAPERERAALRGMDYLVPLRIATAPFDIGLQPNDGLAFDTDDASYGPLFAASLWAIMAEELSYLRKVGVPRNARARYKSLKHPHVKVITLRRTRTEESDAEARHHVMRHWTHRWVVDAFFRHLPGESGCGGAGAVADHDGERCARCGGKITRVVSHVKGPVGLDVQVKERVYNLAR